MKKRAVHIAFLLPLLGALLLTSSPLEAQNEIVQNPEAVLLRKVWMVRGGVVGGDRVGALACGLADLNNDSLEDFIWGVGSTGTWNLQYGGQPVASTPAQSFVHRSTLSYAVAGTFHGGKDLYVAFAGFYTTKPAGRTRYHVEVSVYPVSGDTIDLQRGEVFDPSRGVWPELESTVIGMYAMDVDQDQNDELIIVVPGVQFDQVVDRRAEVWIFEGGPDFQLDSPTVVLKDSEENYNTYYADVGDLDGDSLPDILAAGYYLGGGPAERLVKYNFWWGKNALEDLSIHPDRTLILDKTGSNIDAKFTLIDCDGDGVKDILRLLYADPLGVHLYRSAAGKNARDRSFTLEDAEGYFPGYSILGNGGYINDSLRRYESTILLGSRMLFFGGGKKGPNYSYDAYYSAQDDGMSAGSVFGRGGPIGDATGDGWDDYLTANPSWFNLDQGIAILLEGGPYIPNDDTTLSVQTIATTEHEATFHLWPNPVTDELHIAWRGDLKHPPSHLQVYDMSGRLVVEQNVEGWRGEALWRCGSVASGSYLLVVSDREGRIIAQTRLIKH